MLDSVCLSVFILESECLSLGLYLIVCRLVFELTVPLSRQSVQITEGRREKVFAKACHVM